MSNLIDQMSKLWCNRTGSNNQRLIAIVKLVFNVRRMHGVYDGAFWLFPVKLPGHQAMIWNIRLQCSQKWNKFFLHFLYYYVNLPIWCHSVFQFGMPSKTAVSSQNWSLECFPRNGKIKFLGGGAKKYVVLRRAFSPAIKMPKVLLSGS